MNRLLVEPLILASCSFCCNVLRIGFCGILLVAINTGLGIAAYGQQCSPSDVIALAKAGYSKPDIDRMCQVVEPFFQRSAEAELGTTVFNELLAASMPLKFSSGTIKAAKYCATGDERKAMLVAYGQFGGAENGEASVSLDLTQAPDALSCALTVQQRGQAVAKAGKQLGNHEFLGTFQLAWVPWEFQLSVSETFPANIVVGETLHFTTKDLPVAVGSDTLSFSSSFYFLNDRLAAIFAPSGDVDTITDLSLIPRFSAFSTFGPTQPIQSDGARVRVTHVATQYLLDTYFNGKEQLVVKTGNPVLGDLLLRNLKGGAPSDNQYLVSGTVTFRGSTFLSKALSTGSDLSVATVQITPQSLNNCPSPPFSAAAIRCTAENAAIQGTAGLVAQGLTTAYGGKLLRSFGQLDKVPIRLGSLQGSITTVVNQVSATGSYLQVDTSMSVQP
jgi:hypothetical protein